MPTVSRVHSLQRPAIERMMRIHNRLKGDSYPNCSKLATELEVSSKTVSRDIDFMRDRMLLPIDYDAARHGYYYTRKVESMPTIDISEGELLALSIARKSLDNYKGTPFEKPLANAFNKIAASLPETLTANLEQLSDTISFKQGRLSQIDHQVLQAFTQSALQRKAVTFQYKKPGDQPIESRTIDPYHITNYLGKWYLIGRDHNRDSIRTFLVARASDAQMSTTQFTIPDDFSADNYLWNSFGIYSPTGSYEVEIDFTSNVAEYISENLWHPSQEQERLEDGTLRLKLKLGSLDEVAQWILSWGTDAYARQPKQLQKKLLTLSQSITKKYT